LYYTNMDTGPRPPAHKKEDAARMRAAVMALVRRFSVSERADVLCCGLTVAQGATLEALRATPRMRLGALGRRLGITASTLSRNLARLEADGLVTRIADPGDGRAFRVSLTAAGHRAAEKVERQGVDFADEVLSRLSPACRASIVDSMEALVAAVQAATERCCPGAFTHLMKDFAREPARAGRTHGDDDDDGEHRCSC
jgi:DNA-binding MarR family transcriptional regulator